jgi:hypothetical protein
MVLAAMLCAGSLGQDNVPLIWDGHLMLRVRVAAGGLTPEQRADEIELRLEDLMADQFSHEREDIVGRIIVRPFGRDAIIEGPSGLLLTVTLADAHANDEGVTALAADWRDRIEAAMIVATRTG